MKKKLILFGLAVLLALSVLTLVSGTPKGRRKPPFFGAAELIFSPGYGILCIACRANLTGYALHTFPFFPDCW